MNNNYNILMHFNSFGATFNGLSNAPQKTIIANLIINL